MRRIRSKTIASSPESGILKGWPAISKFLSQPMSVAQRWVKTGMPVKRQGHFVTAVPDELNSWLGREAGGEPMFSHYDSASIGTASLKAGALGYVMKSDAGKDLMAGLLATSQASSS
jgi:hypothetical protein